MIKRENTVIFDDRGIPSIMVKFTKESNKSLFGGSDKTNAMFIIGGEEYDEIHISKYLNTIINGKAYSLPYHKPATDLTLEEAEDACFSKGDGWHMLTAPEWGYLALDSLRNGTLPHGNTDRGHYHANRNEKGQTYDGYRTLTGSGPATWAHDHTPYGVHDLCGNIWEMIAGLRLMDGEIQTTGNNDAASRVDTSESSPLWKPILVGGKSIKFSVEDDLKLTTGESEKGWDGCRWEDIEIDFEIPEELKEIALFPGEKNAWISADTEGERFPARGGYWDFTSYAGVFNSALNRSRADTSFGLRSAFYRKTGNCLLDN